MDAPTFPALEIVNMLLVGDCNLDVADEYEALMDRQVQIDDQIQAIVKQSMGMLRFYRDVARIGPMCGVVRGAMDVGLLRGGVYGMLLRIAIWVAWQVLKHRAGGNDFLISRWMLSRRIEDSDALIERLSIPGQIGATLYWALGSLCVQDPHFSAVFADALNNQGPELRVQFFREAASRRAQRASE